MEKEIVAILRESINTKEKSLGLVKNIKDIAEAMIKTYRNGGKIIFFGNGGSAADAQHLVAELVGKFQMNRVPLQAISLATNISILTAIGNDLSFDEIFSRQVEAIANPTDLVIGISTSGNSKNVINGILVAKRKGAKTIGLTGEKGGKLADIADLVLKVPSNSTPRIQEVHITIGHILCYLVEKALFAEEK